jgi:hypothetical protein
MLLPMLKSATKYYATDDSEINNKNYAAPDPEIGSLKLCRCRLRNRQPKALQLQILKSVAKYYAAADPEIGCKNCAAADPEISTSNYAAADPEIGSLKLFCCRFKNWLPKALLLSILKSTAKYCAAANPEISTDDGVVLA